MSTEVKKEIQLEIAHVLFIDIVGYSKLSTSDQHPAIEELNQVVRASEQFRRAEAANRLIRIPTGDGMVLVFYTSPEAPAQCAVEISGALKEHPRLQLRMGIHSGPVSGVVDVNEKANLAGAGINMAKRVMDCGDAGHILLSKHAAEDLEEYEKWRPLLHDLGSCEVKHGVRVSVVNLYDDQFGNAKLPRRFETVQKRRKRLRWLAMMAALLLVPAIVAGIAMFSRYRVRSTLTAPEKSIAVLPFENLSRDPDNAYFAEGIQEEILTRLAKIADLKVISRTSTQGFQSKPGNLAEIATQLGVANILEGSVQKVADQVRVNVQLVNAQTDFHVWADTYDRKLVDIFGVESEVAKAIAEALQAKLTGQEKQVLAVKPTNNPEAYDAYLRGLAFEARADYHSGTDMNLILEAAGYYERAVQLDPNFAIAWARLSRADGLLYFGTVTETTSAARGDAAKHALENAQKLEPNSAETLLALGYYQYRVLLDYAAAKTTFARVGKMLPGSSEVPHALGLVTRREGHFDQSTAYFEQALARDPRNLPFLMDTATTYAAVRQFPTVLKLYDRALDIAPNDADVMASKASIYQAQGNLQEAARLLSGIHEHTPSDDIFVVKITQLRFERNYGEAVRLLQARLAQFHYASDYDRATDQVALALMQRLAGDTAGVKVTAKQARNALEIFRDQSGKSGERVITKSPRQAADLAAYLSNAYAAIGEKDSALEAAERAIGLCPRAKDPLVAPRYEENLALIQMIFSENSRAISTLTQLLQRPSTSWCYPTPITPALLRLDPLWDPLRSDPAFQKLCEEKKP